MYSIRELSELAGVSARTLRYYGEIGLLKPAHVSEAGYRSYGENEVKLLWQILFYRERGFGLKEIKKLIYQEDSDILSALEEHLRELEEQREHMDLLIRTVENTILSMKGEYSMSDKEKFEVFKKAVVEENEKRYGAEIRERYSEGQVDAANRKILDMSEGERKHFEDLEAEIRERLESIVISGKGLESEEAAKIVRMHKEWLCMTWEKYSPEAHKGVAQLYAADERFTEYYDRKVPGCAELLCRAVEFWADRI